MVLVTRTAASDDADLDARCARIRQRILDAVDATLDDLERPGSQHAAIAHAISAQIAPLVCRQATCRRAQICRGKPCAVLAPRL